MTARTPKAQPPRRASSGGTKRPPPPATLTVARLEKLGLQLSDLVDPSGEGERCIDRIENDQVVLDLGSRVVSIPAKFVPETASEGSWVRFSLQGEELHCTLDMEATLSGQAKLTDLFARLTLTDDE